MPTFGKTGISFDIDDMGKVHDLKLDYPSGNVELDRTSWGSILQASPISFLLAPAKMGCFFQYDSKTAPEPTHYTLPTPVVNAPESAERSERTVSESWDADISVTLEKQINASINGHFSVKRPLYGSGPLTGTNVTDDTIEFHVVPAPPAGYEMNFTGRHTGPGVVSGTYSISDGQSGTFTMHLQPTTTSPRQETEQFNNRFGWYVDRVKTSVAQNWYLKEVSGDTPAGATVYVQFRIGLQGYPSDISVQTSSGHDSLDQSCLNAVERTEYFGHLPAGYKENTLNVLYHCTYPGRPSQSNPPPTVASYNPPSPPSEPPVEPVLPPVDRAWLDYIKLVDALIDQRWRKTAYAGQVSPGETAVRFTVLPNGLVMEPTVTISSGSSAIDTACKAVVENPIGWYAPHLPEGYNSPVFVAYFCK
jgi:TonB family protein